MTVKGKKNKWMMGGDKARSRKGIPQSWKCYCCHRRCKGKSWKLRMAWGSDKPRRKRFCFSCGHMLFDLIDQKAKEMDNSHLPLLEL